MKCDKCIHKPICKFRLESTASVLDRLENCCCYVEVDDPDKFVINGDIAQQPIKKAIEVVYGEWLPKYEGIFECSECYEEWYVTGIAREHPLDNNAFYCPCCGAKMDKENE